MKTSALIIRTSYLIILLLSLFICFTSYAQENSVSINFDDLNLEWGGCPDFMPDGCNISVLQGDPSEANTDVLFKVPANSSIPMHWHTSAERMILLSGEMQVTYEGEEPTILKTGSYAYGPARKPHTAKCGDSGPCVLFIAFNEPVDANSGKPDE
ncbi:cupin domain-containing protein [Christiangramia sp. SM2212]|uniref:Cupin domain-containing protein n=1 Tax=Christiangramia sediminicola TaxID=3073267 RepID=A0ABU1EPA8_9FLAO|nr:cupin domain-containing protein [Christiangramia sp. SM2212]MDR5590231.1 cupin domain-containing protein [Christiangramia sp. SM2212]